MSSAQNQGRVSLDDYYTRSPLPTRSGSPLPPGQSPTVNDLTVGRLTAIAAWIRDHLDPRIARDGPEVMHPDDVLTLHDIFTLLQHTQISANTLRASRIHTAVLAVSGKATRWPGRLADECDRLILIWQHTFGPLQVLRPFLYGRGGRLEGIVTATDDTKSAVLKRWRDTVPDLIAPEKSRRHGDLGFKPGDWWLNPLFAFRAGIIDVESTEGGICFDKNGAYAILLRDSDEIDSISSSSFTYRCRKDDRGRFRLTAADFKSRYPVRVLRAHNLSSLWAPRAGVRYDGLHRVTGWTLRTAKENDAAKTDFNIGELMWEVRFEREAGEEKSMEEVMRHPLAADIDDYAEFKRLRRLQRGDSRLRGNSELETQELDLDHESPTKSGKPTDVKSSVTTMNSDPTGLIMIPARIKRQESMISSQTTASQVLRSPPPRQHSLTNFGPFFPHPGIDIPIVPQSNSSLAFPSLSLKPQSSGSQYSRSLVASAISPVTATNTRGAPNSNDSRMLGVAPSGSSPAHVLRYPDNPATAYVAATGLPLNEVAPWVDLIALPAIASPGIPTSNPSERSARSSQSRDLRAPAPRRIPLHRSEYSATDEEASPSEFRSTEKSNASHSPSPSQSKLESSSEVSGGPAMSRSSIPDLLSSNESVVHDGAKRSMFTIRQQDARKERKKKQNRKAAEDEKRTNEERRKRGLSKLSFPLTKKVGFPGKHLDGTGHEELDTKVNAEIVSTKETLDPKLEPLPCGFSPIRQVLRPVTDKQWRDAIDASPPTEVRTPLHLGLRAKRIAIGDESRSAPPPTTTDESSSSGHVFASVLPESSRRKTVAEPPAKRLNAGLDGAETSDPLDQTTYEFDESDNDKRHERSRSSCDNAGLAHTASQSAKAARNEEVMAALLDFQKIKDWFHRNYGTTSVEGGLDGTNSTRQPSTSSAPGASRPPAVPTIPEAEDVVDVSSPISVPNATAEHSRRASSQISEASSGDISHLGLLTHTKSQMAKAEKKASEWAALAEWQARMSTINNLGIARQLEDSPKPGLLRSRSISLPLAQDSRPDSGRNNTDLPSRDSRGPSEVADIETSLGFMADPPTQRRAISAAGHDFSCHRRFADILRTPSGETAHLNLLTHAKPQSYKAEKKQEEWAALRDWQIKKAEAAYDQVVVGQKGKGPLMKESTPADADTTGKIIVTDPFAKKSDREGAPKKHSRN